MISCESAWGFAYSVEYKQRGCILYSVPCIAYFDLVNLVFAINSPNCSLMSAKKVSKIKVDL